MSHDNVPATSTPATKAGRVKETVRRLVLMKETGPKSAAWHRARVQMIWRLHRQLEQDDVKEREPASGTLTDDPGGS